MVDSPRISEARDAAIPQRVPWRRRLVTWAKRLLLLAMVWLVVHLTIMFLVGYSEDLRPADAAVVLGNYVNNDGTPGPVVKARLDRALELYRSGLVHTIIVSGAVWTGNYNEPAGMRRYLIEQGVPAKNIIEDPRGVNTYHTAINTLATMRERNIRSVTIVTDFYHILRTRLAFSLTGIEDARSVYARAPIDAAVLFSVGRDTVAFYRYLFHDYHRRGVPGKGAPAAVGTRDAAD